VDTSVRQSFERVLSDPRVKAALAAIERAEPEAIKEQFRLTEIPAPPFKEEKRAAHYLDLLKARGLDEAYLDEEGNAIGLRKGNGNGPLLLIAAHLDTVFPEGVDTSVKERNGRFYAPGIGDDTRGLAAMLSVIDALNASGIETEADIMFAGNVGEEGRGDLRGIKAIFRDHPDIDGFISIDGVRMGRITNGGTGSRRFEFRFTGPGGHSFGAFGLASAIHAMGRAIAKIGDLETPSDPKTTFTVGTVAGGTSVNSIAADAVFAIDMRSNDRTQLAILEQKAKDAALEAVAEENARWGRGEISVDFVLIGDRPVGRTEPSSPLVQLTRLAFDELAIEFRGLSISSTDSNVPMSLGIPAITIDGGGDGGGAHSPDEWFVPTDSHLGPQASLLLILGLAGIEGSTQALLPKL
jgi:acetylornithine deacetylase/succinyl-diaminopimelate desuccinylase-like protein